MKKIIGICILSLCALPIVDLLVFKLSWLGAVVTVGIAVGVCAFLVFGIALCQGDD